MPGQIVHFEIPADDTAKGREFWGSLFGWQFEAFPGPSEYHMTRIGDQTGGAITNMEPGKRGTHAYFDVDDINAGAARVKELAARQMSQCRCRAWAGSRPAPIRTETSSASGRPTRPPRPPPREPVERPLPARATPAPRLVRARRSRSSSSSTSPA